VFTSVLKNSRDSFRMTEVNPEAPPR
jgi:hypothetical protein